MPDQKNTGGQGFRSPPRWAVVLAWIVIALVVASTSLAMLAFWGVVGVVIAWAWFTSDPKAGRW